MGFRVNAPKKFFCTGWPSEITCDEMQPYYQMVTDMLKPQPIPRDQWNPRIQLLHDAAENRCVADMLAPVGADKQDAFQSRRIAVAPPHGGGKDPLQQPSGPI
ncbi:MAG: hypothetical protein IH847_11110 [Acidobacteria bacterium]|nr:hypothetical protein [Acidobacteriota bacterium]